MLPFETFFLLQSSSNCLIPSLLVLVVVCDTTFPDPSLQVQVLDFKQEVIVNVVTAKIKIAFFMLISMWFCSYSARTTGNAFNYKGGAVPASFRQQ